MAVNNINTTLKNVILEKDFADVRALDTVLLSFDGTPNKSKF
jgi:enolase